MRKHRILSGCALMLALLPAGADPELTPEPMIVSGEPVRPVSVTLSPLATVSDAITMLPEADLRSQGGIGGQSDLSIRGSSFSGAGLSLNGMALPNAQTEHFNLEFPIPAGLLTAPRVYTGYDQIQTGEGHLVGTVDVSLNRVETVRHLSAGIEEKAGYQGALLARHRFALSRGGAIGVGAFAGFRESNAVDADDNNVRLRRGGGQLQWVDADGRRWDLVLARQVKTFGARGYYGVTRDWEADEEIGDTLLFASMAKGDDPRENRYRVAALYREQTDDYTLFWILPGVFRNTHRLDTYGATADGRLRGDRAMLDWRISADQQYIRSDSLGDRSRARMGLAAIPGLAAGKWDLHAGARLEIFEEEVNEFLPQAAIGYRLCEGLAMQLAYSESVRQPSYTELNYESPASLGNAGLKNQTATTLELRFEGRVRTSGSWMLGLFRQDSHDTVDWIRPSAESVRWEATNIGTVETVGLEARLGWESPSGSRLGLYYSALSKDADADAFASRYALDYPEHLLRLSGQVMLGRRLGVEFAQTLRRQASHPLREGDDVGYDGMLALHALAFRAPAVRLTVAAHNIWDDDYPVFAGQPDVAPTRFSASVAMDW